MSDSSPRKREHIEFCLTDKSQRGDPGFANYRLIPEAFPELNMADINLERPFLGRTLSFPFVIASMTGGTGDNKGWNRQLAFAAENQRVALALGSMRGAVGHPDIAREFDVRAYAPNSPIVGNIGAWQLRNPKFRKELIDLTAQLQLDGMFVHVNPAQELVQPEGERDFSGTLNAVIEFMDEIPIPVFLKGVGCGVTTTHLAPLIQNGLEGLDTAGFGGTHFPTVEASRHGADLATAETLQNWGVPTSEMITSARQFLDTLPDIGRRPTLIGSGGIRTALDIALVLALGADFASSAQPLLKAASQGPSAIENTLASWRAGLKSLCLLTGCQVPLQLRTRVRKMG